MAFAGGICVARLIRMNMFAPWDPYDTTLAKNTGIVTENIGATVGESTRYTVICPVRVTL